MTRKYRAQILLEPSQHAAMAAIAEREGRSVSEVARELVSRGLDDLAREADSVWRVRALALARLDQIRGQVEREHCVFGADLVAEARTDRERQADAVRHDGGQ